MAATLKKTITQHLTRLAELQPDELVAARYEKLRKMGVYQE